MRVEIAIQVTFFLTMAQGGVSQAQLKRDLE